MINPNVLYQFLQSQDINFFTGVPDSVLKDLIIQIEDNHITANEGSALAKACGYHLATGKTPFVYLQNSGLGNLINPLTSIAQNYQLPILMFVGWRGEGADEPQHLTMGKASSKIFDAIDLPYEVLSIDMEKAKMQISSALDRMQTQRCSYAFLIRNKTFESKHIEIKNEFEISRVDTIAKLIEQAPEQTRFFANVGYTGRELYHLAKEKKLDHSRFFYGTGGMGHIGILAHQYALSNDNPVICLDGDGSFGMHLGNFLTIASQPATNLKYVLFNNQSHLSVKGDHTALANFSGAQLAKALKIKVVSQLDDLLKAKKFAMWEVMCSTDTIEGLPRPTETPLELIEAFKG